jgi:hypothetical protein
MLISAIASYIIGAAAGILPAGARCQRIVFMTESKTPFCPGCEQQMRFIQALPQSGVLREIAIFYCHQCKHAETIAEKHAA